MLWRDLAIQLLTLTAVTGHACAEGLHFSAFHSVCVCSKIVIVTIIVYCIMDIQCSNLEDWKSDFFVNVYFSAILNMIMENKKYIMIFKQCMLI